MRFNDSFQRFNQKQISVLLPKSAINSNHFNLLDKQSNRFNETQNIDNTVYCSWGGVTLHYSPIRPPPQLFPSRLIS